MAVKTLEKLDLRNKKVLLRVDFNVPLQDGKISDDTRMRAALPTINYLLSQPGTAVIIASHLGRPKNGTAPEFSLQQLQSHLQYLTGAEVHFAADCVGPLAEKAAAELQPGEILLLENTRFHPQETANDAAFVRQLAALADAYVNDAFGSAHRAHASTEGVAHLLPAAAGYLMAKECKFFQQILDEPRHPLVAIIGGAKVSSKIAVLESLLESCDTFIIAGGMAYTFHRALGRQVGQSLLEQDYLATASTFLAKAKERGVEVLLPVDFYGAKDFSPTAERVLIDGADIPADLQGLDIGPKTVELIREKIATANMVVWNGPVGVFEFNAFAHGTLAVAKMVAACSGVTVVGGGDSVAAVNKFNLASQINHVSTGGGASLEYLEGKILPGVAVLQG